MPLITHSDLTTRHGIVVMVQASNADDLAATTLNAERVDAAIADVDALVLSKLAPRYRVPLASVPLVLRNVCCDLVLAQLLGSAATDRQIERERAAMKLLDGMARGDVSLGLDAAAAETAPVSGPQVTGSGAERVFSAALLADYTGGA